MQDQCAASEHPLRPRRNLQARGVARVRALARHGHICPQRLAVPDFQEGAAARTLPQAERHGRVEAVVQVRCMGCQHPCSPRKGVNARWLARAWALAGLGHSCSQGPTAPAVHEAAAADVFRGGVNVGSPGTALAPHSPPIPSVQLEGACKHEKGKYAKVLVISFAPM